MFTHSEGNMPTQITTPINQITYTVYTKQELEARGLVVNNHMWIASGWMFCINCNSYQYHYAMSHKSVPNCIEVCRTCDCHVADKLTEMQIERRRTPRN